MNILDILSIAASIVPDRTALVAGGEEQSAHGTASRTSYERLADRARRLATALRQAGVRAGDRVGLMEVNSPQHAEACFACAQIDAIFVPLNFRARPAELKWMLDNVGPRMLIAGSRYARIVDEAAGKGTQALRRMALGEERLPAGWDSYRAIVAESPPSEHSPQASDSDATMIMFTSGASARPKGVVLTHASFCSYVLENVTPADPDPASEERTILTVPLYHIAGVQALFAGVYGGRTQVIQPQFDPVGWMSLVEREKVARAMLVPTMLKALVDCPDFGAYDLSSLKLITYGAAAMPTDTLERAIAALPNARFINAFGQTETAATITMLGPDDHVLEGSPEEVARKRRRLRSIGRPLPDVEVRVVDSAGNEVSEGVPGEIVARGPRLMKGYWGNPGDTAAAIHGGWLHTGDLGYRDADGYIFLQGRAREIIKRGGEMISPEEVEEVLSRHPAVAEVAVIGVPDPDWGEVVHAVVVLKPEAPRPLPASELIEFCRREIASYKKPERVHFVEELPRNQLGKVLRGELRARYGAHPR